MPDHLNQVFFTMGGGDANEHAIRMARLFTQRYKVLSSSFSYHGSTPLALAVSGDQRRWPLDMAISGSVRFYTPYLFRSRFYATDEEQEMRRSLSHLEDQIKIEGPDTIAAILIEPIGTAFGALIPPADYLAGVRALCDRYGILLIFDEVASGFGRTGEWFAMDHYGVEPDLVTLGKGLTGGYAPLGCAAVIANIDVIGEEGIVAHAKHLGQALIGPRLEEMKTRFSHIGEIRGVGAYWSLELVEDLDSRTPLSFTTPSGEQIPATTELARICRAKGLLVGSKSTHTTFAPPCNASTEEVTRGLSILEEALALVDPRSSAETT